MTPDSNWSAFWFGAGRMLLWFAFGYAMYAIGHWIGSEQTTRRLIMERREQLRRDLAKGWPVPPEAWRGELDQRSIERFWSHDDVKKLRAAQREGGGAK